MSASTPPPNQIYPLGVKNIGDVINQPNSCMVLGTNVDVCYDNGEFESIAPDSFTGCCYIDGGPNWGTAFINGACAGCPQLDDCLFAGGGPVRCRLTNYSADNTQCALQGISPITSADGKKRTCNPDALPGGSQYDQIVRNYCLQGNNLITDNRCVAFCTNNDCTQDVLSACKGNNLNTDGCKQLCFAGNTKYDCSVNLTNYCQDPANQKKDVCSCFLPASVYEQYYTSLLGTALPQDKVQALINQIETLPECSYPPCSTGNFKPRVVTQCPEQAICINSAVVEGNNVNFNGSISFQQQCQSLIGTGGNPTPPPVEGTNWLLVILIIGIILLVIIFMSLIIAVIVKNSKKSSNVTKTVVK